MKTNKKKSHYYTIVFTDGEPEIVFNYRGFRFINNGNIVSNYIHKMATNYIETYFN